ncbi:hypothetical protein PBI_TAKODA_57 [Rhodococcus phage Takoda]|uniref:Uncharacterized protein n=2 Tax=Rerduovirus TaxID=1982375 RepID=A0A1S5VY88_9CAUD|nr:hypothetical protein HWB63_gp17 [Rhodococcus phage Takoda]AQP30916.1 hypothetical protein SEA_ANGRYORCHARD_54 [Rhodococcus phage AngryOrchard]AWY06318.1 hypothetical protein PBI_TAKODA_57 [Rhodococcus phage Takoda]
MLDSAVYFEVNVENFLHASREGNTMIVTRSLLVADDDPWLEPVREALASAPFSVSRDEEELDPSFMFGRKRTTIYEITEEV